MRTDYRTLLATFAVLATTAGIGCGSEPHSLAETIGGFSTRAAGLVVCAEATDATLRSVQIRRYRMVSRGES